MAPKRMGSPRDVASADYAFAPSLRGVKERAVLGLHEAWGQCDVEGGHPPPPMMVMIAAMLRRPLLDTVRNTTSGVSVQGELPTVAQLVEAGEVEVIREMRFASSWTGETATAMATIDDGMTRAIFSRQVPAFLAAVERFDSMVPNFKYCLMLSVDVPTECANRRLFNVPGLSNDPTVVAVRDARQCLGRGEGTYVNRAKLQLVAQAYREATDHRFQGPLPVADLRELVRRQQDHPTEVVLTLYELVRTKAHTAADVLRGLEAMDRGDIAACVFATLGRDAVGVVFKLIQRWARAKEVTWLAQRSLTEAAQRAAPWVDDAPYPLLLMSAFRPGGEPTVRVATADSVRGLHMAVRRKHALPTGKYAYHHRSEAMSRWQRITRGLLDDWDWANCIATGDAVLRALVADDEVDAGFGQMDLFFFGLSPQQWRVRVQELADHIRGHVDLETYAVLVAHAEVMIVVEKAARLRIVTGLWPSADAVLSSFGVDSRGVGWTGRDFVMTGRAAAALAVRANVASASRHMMCGSMDFEIDLWKHSQLYGFGVVDPLHAPTDPTLQQRRNELRDFFAHARGAVGSRALTGLYWLIAADAGWFVPESPRDRLSLLEGRNIRDVIAVVPIDNDEPDYGQDDDGVVVRYKVVRNGEPPEDYPPPPSEIIGTPRYLYATNFASYLPFPWDGSTVGVLHYEKHDAWLVSEPAPARPTRPTPHQTSSSAPRDDGRGRGRGGYHQQHKRQPFARGAKR